MAGTILQSPFFVEVVLPFVLLFVILFAILQKTKVLGDGKKQIDAIVAAVMALIVISFASAVGIINALMPFLAVSVVVVLIFLILYGMWFHGKTFEIGNRIRNVGGILVAIAVVIAVLVVTGGWDYLGDLFFSSGSGSAWLANVIFFVIIAAAIGVVLYSSKDDSGGGEDDD